jgi:hypothetical protein
MVDVSGGTIRQLALVGGELKYEVDRDCAGSAKIYTQVPHH